MKYSEQLQDPRWLVKRLNILIRDKFTCQICGYVSKKIHVHHRKYEGMVWDAKDEDLISLCSHCHRIEHRPDKADKKFEKMKLSNIIEEARYD